MKKHDFADKQWILDFYGSAVSWWGESWYEGTNLQERCDFLGKYLSPGAEILELGAGTGETALFLAHHGYKVTAVDITPENIELIRRMAREEPAVTPILGDFQNVKIPKRFDAVVLFETFGMGTDSEQRRLIERIEREWLNPGGVLILDVYHPFGPMRDAGNRADLDALDDVPTSVAMHEYTDYDLVNSRWIDTWEPILHPENAKSQSIRCYTPADLKLLLSESSLDLLGVFFDGKEMNLSSAADGDIDYKSSFEDNYAYRVVFRRK